MFGLFGKSKESKAREYDRPGRTLEVGWINQADTAGVIWFDPQQFKREGGEPASAKAVQNCPAVLDYESRFFVVPCPVDLNILLARDKDGKIGLRNVDGPQSAVTGSHVAKLVHISAQNQWRHPERPIIQIGTPYRFICDEPAYMSQMPPFMHYRREPLPGVFIGGRFSIYAWPRIMMWAFEWLEPQKPLVLRRGEPWFYLRFETDDPTRPVRMVEAEWTPELEKFAKSTDGVTNFVRRTFSLFPTAEKRRPKKLLKKVQR